MHEARYPAHFFGFWPSGISLTDAEFWVEKRDPMREVVAKDPFLGKAASAEAMADACIYLVKDTNAPGSMIRSSGWSLVM